MLPPGGKENVGKAALPVLVASDPMGVAEDVGEGVEEVVAAPKAAAAPGLTLPVSVAFEDWMAGRVGTGGRG